MRNNLIKIMAKQQREKVSFITKQKISKPVRVEFYTKQGEKVSFKGHEQAKRPVKIEFYAKKNKQK